MKETLNWCALNGKIWPDLPSLTALTQSKAQARQVQLTWKSLMRAHAGPHLLKASWLLAGRQAQLSHLETLIQHPQWCSRIEEAKGLAPLLAQAVECGQPASAHLQALKEGSRARGLLPRTWTWLYHQPPRIAQKLFARGLTPQSIWWANLLSAAHPEQSSRLSGWLSEEGLYGAQHFWQKVQNSPSQAAAISVTLQRLVRLLPAPTSQHLIQWESVVFWLETHKNLDPSRLPVGAKSTWSSLLRKVREDHARRFQAGQAHLLTAPDSTDARYPRLFDFEPTLRGVHVEELLSESALKIEGLVMDHCVGNGSYHADCEAGIQRIFRLTEPQTGARATLQIRYSQHRWRVVQLAGYRNSRVPALFWTVARDMVARPRMHQDMQDCVSG